MVRLERIAWQPDRVQFGFSNEFDQWVMRPILWPHLSLGEKSKMVAAACLEIAGIPNLRRIYTDVSDQALPEMIYQADLRVDELMPDVMADEAKAKIHSTARTEWRVVADAATKMRELIVPSYRPEL